MAPPLLRSLDIAPRPGGLPLANARRGARRRVPAGLLLPRSSPPKAVPVCSAPRRSIRRLVHAPQGAPRRQKAGGLDHGRQPKEVRQRDPSSKRDRSHPRPSPSAASSAPTFPRCCAAPSLSRLSPSPDSPSRHRPNTSAAAMCAAAVVLIDRGIESRLRRGFKEALCRASRCKRQIFVELYAGIGSLAKAWRNMGYGVIAFEIDAGEQYNLLHPVVRRVLLGWLRSGCIRGVWPGTTCTSWSRARRGPANSSWGL